MWINSALKSKTKWGKKPQQVPHSSYTKFQISTLRCAAVYLGWWNVCFSLWHVQLCVHVFLFLSVLCSRLLFWRRVSTVTANAARLTLCNPLQTQIEPPGLYYQFTEDSSSLKQLCCVHAGVHWTQQGLKACRAGFVTVGISPCRSGYICLWSLWRWQHNAVLCYVSV